MNNKIFGGIIMKTNEKIRVEVIPPKRRKAKEYRENLHKKSGNNNATKTGPVQTGPILLQQRKLSRKEKQTIWNAAVDAAFSESRR